MRNQKQINVAKFERIRWKQKDGAFYGQQDISRKPFGWFTVYFQIGKGGITGVEVRSWEHKDLYWAQTYATYEQAVDGVKKRFETIDELIKDLEERNRIIQEECRQMLAQAIAACMEERRQQENGARSYEQEGGNL